MATDYDAPRRRAEDEIETDSLEGLKASENDNSGMDDDGEFVEPFEPPTVDLTGEELNVTVVPRQENEFTCSVCFLVQSKKRLSHEEDGQLICLDCA
ncbi:DUF4193 domain-containing protein [Corynebacterium flavescens]|uniref:DUF4193 domain-containing protein n=1 Tax=Corynebacterium flavescens TaxID=28028 RepID=UPI0026488F9A|nr:DUF4193 domain-containing protein [Corynebacterium flavescens]MDN6199434.1 DUF4193 domain-containing protein [Corynebacterium flavescens]MDN6226432.1 DUF4193 domain-containing protein [Corynebacterium flavescens]MDN6236968.1 DUF4193 domain-containing protein [Corynebacterium flavescens]MDN6431932.1 DUF4193 domain-containing protein [Corynebacterium flavescens]MDN6475871.1 DUF4193 domain-containing protein [Corynebacterium flavescens]